MNTQDALEIAKQYVLGVKKSGIAVTHAYLFGSYSKGITRKDSDIDVCIISSSFSDDRLKERLKLMSITHNYSDDIEPHPLTNEEFNNRYDPFVKEVKKGVKIV